jgi:signal transduction histidine kinase
VVSELGTFTHNRPVPPPLVLAFRWITLAWMVLLSYFGGDVKHPLLSLVSTGTALAWTVWLTLASPRHGPLVLLFDLAQAAGIVLASGVVVPQYQLLAGHPFFAGAYPMAAALGWGVRFGVSGGLVAGGGLALALVGAYAANGVDLTALTYVQALKLSEQALAYPLVGAAVGVAAIQLRHLTELGQRTTEQTVRLRERERMVGIIHDDVIQGLATIRRDVRALPGTAGSGDRIAERIRRQEDALRALAVGDAPASRHRRSLATTLAELADGYGAAPVRLVTSGPLSLPPDRLDAIVGAIREALLNVAKHAAARRVWVTALAEPDGTVSVCVRDDGTGFAYDEAELARNGKLGLAISIRARVARFGGTAVIDSRPGWGTEVTVRMPLGEGD